LNSRGRGRVPLKTAPIFLTGMAGVTQVRASCPSPQAAGMRLKQLGDEVLCISLRLDTAYPKLSAAARLSYKAAQALDRLRSALDRQAFLDYCQ
jgi:hypothetical protein